MDGSSIKKAVEALTLFLQSLPSGSFFNVVSFGSGFNHLFPKAVEYSKENLENAISKCSNYTGDMGGTNLLSPIQNVLSANLATTSLPRHVFVLTDGEIEDPKATCQYISGFSHNTRVHTFGFGSGVDRYLVKEMAKNGKGKCFILSDISS